MDDAIIVITIIGFVVAIPQLWGESWKDIWKRSVDKSVSWEIVQNAYKKIVAELNSSAFYPTVVIGVGRGGSIAAGLISSELLSRDLSQISNARTRRLATKKIRLEIIDSTVHYKKLGSTENYEVDRIELSPPELSVTEKDSVLLVVAETFSGHSLFMGKEMLRKQGVNLKRVRTATLFLYEQNDYRVHHTPDLIGATTKLGRVMPWKNKKYNTNRFSR